MRLHPDITLTNVMDAVERQRGALENPGFCTACGAEAEGCEPDARDGECEACGENAVYGAEELLLMIAA